MTTATRTSKKAQTPKRTRGKISETPQEPQGNPAIKMHRGRPEWPSELFELMIAVPGDWRERQENSNGFRFFGFLLLALTLPTEDEENQACPMGVQYSLLWNVKEKRARLIPANSRRLSFDSEEIVPEDEGNNLYPGFWVDPQVERVLCTKAEEMILSRKNVFPIQEANQKALSFWGRSPKFGQRCILNSPKPSNGHEKVNLW
jgi:hypothetical protein